jgi:hypothetical protein
MAAPLRMRNFSVGLTSLMLEQSESVHLGSCDQIIAAAQV